MTSASVDPQRGQRGADRGSGCGSGSGWIEPLLLEAPEHPERALVDAARPAAPAFRVPGGPIALQSGRRPLQSLLEPGHELVGPHRKRAAAMELGCVPVRGPEPLDRLPPGLVQGLLVDARLEPAASVQEVITLLA